MDNTKTETINWDFLKEYIPAMELAALKEHAEGEEKEHFVELLSEVEKQIRAMPSYGALCEKEAQDINIGMHYFGGATDFWLFELDQEEKIGMAFVCLNGDTWNAEIGSVYIPEIIAIPFLELDLYWNEKTTLKEVMDKVKSE